MSKARILQSELKSKLGETEQYLIMGCQNAPCHQASPEPGSHLSPRLNDLSLSPVTENVSLSQSWDHSHLSIATEPAQQTPPYIKYLLGLGPGGFWGKARRSTHNSPTFPSETRPLDFPKQSQRGGVRSALWDGRAVHCPFYMAFMSFVTRCSLSVFTKLKNYQNV